MGFAPIKLEKQHVQVDNDHLEEDETNWGAGEIDLNNATITGNKNKSMGTSAPK